MIFVCEDDDFLKYQKLRKMGFLKKQNHKKSVTKQTFKYLDFFSSRLGGFVNTCTSNR